MTTKPLRKRSGDAAIAAVALDPAAETPLHVQLAGQLRQLILARRLPAGARLPSSRQFAQELNVSRSTVVTALDQLASEGYCEGRHGSGVYVTADLPEHALEIAAAPAASRGEGVAAHPKPVRPFQVAAPDLSLFPHEDWARLAWKIWRSPDPDLLATADPMGWLPLRRAIADHLAAARGLACHAGQILVTSGIGEAVAIMAQALFRRGDRIWVEDPGFPLLLRALSLAGLRVSPVAVDANGLMLERMRGKASAVAVTPSRHYPLGMTMPVQRRLELIAWAEKTGGWIVEDDYDSEFRYRGRPLPALMSLDPNGRTLYLGSFSKVISPAMRLSFLVVPDRLAQRFSATIAQLGAKASLMPQPVLAEFMASGQFGSHIRRMRRVYAKRQAALIDAARHNLAGIADIEPQASGMHVIARLTVPHMTDAEASRRAEAAGLVAPALSSYAMHARRERGLVLGYAAFSEQEIDRAVVTLASALRT
jgi:GntR family transcriptional regulator/MocR family aminotransferase